ncbi:hypothetical protein QJS10_CPB04g00423 [Acorus calamus]|uniref:Uncharacterized protein n=1 Tax=Acorus calamus TaxID=4465 RepID=A0AAV9EZ74_ACOCL|nr:hypothetical protein QJS10_CPB04g00423 [Acorus calamus]
MLRLLREKLLRVSTHGAGSSSPTPKISILWFIHGNPSPKSISSISESTPTDPKSFTVSYLTSSCGLSPEAALRASKWVTLKTTKNADLVLDFFRNHGFDQIHIAKVITGQPMLLSLHVERILKPKMDFLTRYGFSSSQLIKNLSRSPKVLCQSLENQIIPSFKFLEGVIGKQEDVIVSVNRSMDLLHIYSLKRLKLNISYLRDHGVPASHVSKFLLRRPNMFCMVDPDRFRTSLVTIHGMGFNPLSTMFVEAVGTLLISKTNWEEKSELYRNLGWSEDDLLSAFKKQPKCMQISEKKIKRGFEFFVGELGCHPSLLSGCPVLLFLDLEKRVIPRCSVLQVLLSKGLIKKDMKWTYALIPSEKRFLERFVTKYEEEVPELMRAYQGMTESRGTKV